MCAPLQRMGRRTIAAGDCQVNACDASIARESDAVLPTLGGPEIGVASTKAFTCQLTVLACLAIAAGKARGVIGPELEAELVKALVEVPRHMATMLGDERPYEALAHSLSKARDVLYLGRGSSYPIALEGALKLKEISYIHAEGYAAGELKHGPIALIDEEVPVIVIAPRDGLFDKTVSNMQEVAARDGKIIMVSDADPAATGCAVQTALSVPTVHPFESFSTSSSTETSHRTKSALPPSATMASTTGGPLTALREPQTTLAPSRANTSAMLLPMPAPVPVTTATFSFSLIRLSFLLACQIQTYC